ncbi:CoA ester lyase [Marinomonas sp. 15G1-11]|uniref:CoA ester lyase n=1 Tax=Marinomonas phaeophyticola TaxID=3004091 RepID=A0ABT4JW89_9GAMM|nr:CoA ester lyase [Marinomonas sp. 15G1-11]MCZ2722648.1 CoA ester lyase [Marinomonas sp. 15G1-11]
MWNSLLFIPVLEERFIAKAPERGASAIVLDLEASIAHERKDEARAALFAAVEHLRPHTQVTVRINSCWLDAYKDLEACIIEGVSAVHLANCQSPAEIEAIDGLISELEQVRGLKPGAIQVVAMLESPVGVRQAYEIATASERVVALTLGVEDYATEMGTKATESLLRPAAYNVIQAARAAGVSPLVVPASMANFSDFEALERAAEYGKSLGSVGGYAVHPGQVVVLNKVFTPTEQEISQAKRILEAAEQAAIEGKGVFKVDGCMIDLPLIKRAEALLKSVPKAFC